MLKKIKESFIKNVVKNEKGEVSIHANYLLYGLLALIILAFFGPEIIGLLQNAWGSIEGELLDVISIFGA